MDTLNSRVNNIIGIVILSMTVMFVSACQTSVEKISGVSVMPPLETDKAEAHANNAEILSGVQSTVYRPELEASRAKIDVSKYELDVSRYEIDASRYEPGALRPELKDAQNQNTPQTRFVSDGLNSMHGHYGAVDTTIKAYRVVIPIQTIGHRQASDMARYLQPLVNEIAAWQVVRRVTVIGHSDSEGSEQSNMLLSIRRADAVADQLAEMGVETDLLTVEAYGEGQPIGDNTTLEGRKANRRVEVVVTGYPENMVFDEAQLARRAKP